MQRNEYKIVNGRLVKIVINPEVKSDSPPSYSDSMKDTLPVISSIEDQMAVSEVTKLDAPKQFQETIATLNSDAYIKKFGADTKAIDGTALLEGLSKLFNINEIPIGLMSKLVALQGATIHFKIDDSGSMKDPSNLLVQDVSAYMKDRVATWKTHTTRWEEAHDRLHILVDLLAYVPTGPIILSLFDHDDDYGNVIKGKRIVLERNGRSPEEFKAYAHETIYSIFNKTPNGDTPIFLNLSNMLDEARVARGSSDARTMHYILSDGEPNGRAREIKQIKNLLLPKYSNRNPALDPITFLGCSNDRRDYAWMHELEEIAPNVAALPDFRDERMEVLKDQGRAFPYTRGLWLLCNIAAAINPYDLDTMDQHMPFTKPTLENLLGHGLLEADYRHYFNCHPNANRVFLPDYELFLQAQFAHDIPSVQVFQKFIADRLSDDMDDNEDDTDDKDELLAEQAVIEWRRRLTYSRPQVGSVQQGMFARPPVSAQQPVAEIKPVQACCVIL